MINFLKHLNFRAAVYNIKEGKPLIPVPINDLEITQDEYEYLAKTASEEFIKMQKQTCKFLRLHKFLTTIKSIDGESWEEIVNFNEMVTNYVKGVEDEVKNGKPISSAFVVANDKQNIRNDK